jgi:hypothetical protein
MALVFPTSPTTGQTYISPTGLTYTFNGTTWSSTYNRSGVVRQTFCAANSNITNGQTVFTISGGYTPYLIDVYLDGVKLVNAQNVNVSNGTTITLLTTTASASSTVDVVGASTLSLANYLPLTGGIISGPLTASSGVTLTDGSTQSTAGYTGFRNRIINGDMRIDQRNNGAAQLGINNTYTIDRWFYNGSQSSKFNSQQNAGSITPPVGFSYYIGLTSTSLYSVTASDNFIISQGIEGYNISDLSFGSASAKSLTISFWIYTSITGTHSLSLRNYNDTRSYLATFSIPVANTWTYVTLSIPGDTSGTWNTTNSVGIFISFNLGTGSTFSNTVSGSWITGNYTGVTGAVSVVATSGATFYVTGVQLEKGSIATPFEIRPYGTELALCQRYYQVGYTGICRSVAGGSYGGGITFLNLPVTMRTTPSITSTYVSGSYNSGYVIWASTINLEVWFSAGTTVGDYSNLSYTLSAEF